MYGKMRKRLLNLFSRFVFCNITGALLASLLLNYLIPLVIVYQGQDLVISNVGDSWAILGTMSADNRLMAVQLTVDLKPNLPSKLFNVFYLQPRCFSGIFVLKKQFCTIRLSCFMPL